MDGADEALQSQVGGSIEDVRSSTNTYIIHQHALLFGGVAILCLAISAVSGYEIYLLYLANPAAFDARIIILPILPILGISWLYNYYRLRVQHLFVEQIASTLGYTYEESAPVESVVGTSLAIGHSQRVYDVISGTYHSYPVRIFTYQYTVGYGKNARTYTKAVFELTYTNALPHIILKPASWTNEFGSVAGMSTVNLEGDFGKHFTLLVGNDAQVQAREIFEPDIMQDLIQKFSGYNCEIVGNKVYLTRTGPIYKREDFLELHDLADNFTDKVIPGLRSAAEDQVPAPAAM
ncbi:MAG TPA: hypothetical protein VMH91_01780 [Candidatus Paceibacterota bacterium]|nr:hypothetical protein [Candidatus Paceibacterota bacterium]